MPLREILILCADCYPRMRRYELGDAVISAAIQRCPDNTAIEQVLTKVVLINSLFGTAIFDTVKISQHICNIAFDAKVRESDISVIDDLRIGHGIRTRANNDRDLYSFATKYASWHGPQKFPIYDNLVKKLLPRLNRTHHFHESFSQTALDSYPLLKDVVDSLITSVHLEELKYKPLDQGLWVYAKYLYKRNELPSDIVRVVQEAAYAA